MYSGRMHCICYIVLSINPHTQCSEHPEYGLGYQWDPSTTTIHPGDTVNWSWTGSSFTARRGVAQVSRRGDTEYNGVGFRSERSVTGSFRKTFAKTGVYYFIAEGYGHIGKIFCVSNIS